MYSTGKLAWLRSQPARWAFHSCSMRRAIAEISRPVGHWSTLCSGSTRFMILSMLSNRRNHGGARGGMLRGLGIMAVLLVWLALAGLGGTSMGKLSEVQENSAAAFLPDGAES